MKNLDPTKMKDWEIAEAAGEQMKNIKEISRELGLSDEELLPYGHYVAKVDFKKILDRLSGKSNGKYIDVTAITPTPLGEGKSTTAIGLIQGLGRLEKNVIGAIRGMGTRYKEDESLINLEIIEEKQGGKNIRLYGLTSFGREVIESLNK